MFNYMGSVIKIKLKNGGTITSIVNELDERTSSKVERNEVISDVEKKVFDSAVRRSARISKPVFREVEGTLQFYKRFVN